MSDSGYTKIISDGLWNNNPGLVQLLGLCPLLAITTSAINGLGLGLATTLTLVTTNVTVSLSRKLIRPEVRMTGFRAAHRLRRHHHRAGHERLVSRPLQCPGHFHPADRGQLQHHRARRGLRLEEYRGSRAPGWSGHGHRIHPGADHPRRPA